MVQQVKGTSVATAVTQAATAAQVLSLARKFPHVTGTAKKKEKQRTTETEVEWW